MFFQDDDDDVRGRGSSLWSGKSAGEAEKKQKLIKAALYAVQVFYSFFIMCVSSNYGSKLQVADAAQAPFHDIQWLDNAGGGSWGLRWVFGFWKLQPYEERGMSLKQPMNDD